MVAGDLTPTDEQAEAIRLAMTGGHLAIEAGAGCAKSSTLLMIADAKKASGNGNGIYCAFNKRVADDARVIFPKTVDCRTAHSLAYQAVGFRYKHRLNKPRLKSQEIAQRAGIDPMMIRTENGLKRLAPGFLAGILVKAMSRFCQSSDEDPRWWHVPVPETMTHDRDLMNEWKNVRVALEPSLRKAWADLQDPAGSLPFTPDGYLKIWSLSHPKIETDFILADESQDLFPAWLSIMEDQRSHAQLVIVGDAEQMLYAWRSSVNAMKETEVDHRATLSWSFRFGEEIAEQANNVLSMLGSPLRLVGKGPRGRVGSVDFPDMVLCRTNAVCVRRALDEFDRGGLPFIVGGQSDVVSFARGALSLQQGRSSWHADLACFDSWSEVKMYVEDDELGGELALLVKLVEDFGAQRIVDAFEDSPHRDKATMIVSTVHKMKGGAARSVQLADDFAIDSDEHPATSEDKRIVYVGITRAETELDIDAVRMLRKRGRHTVPFAEVASLNAWNASDFDPGDTGGDER